MASNLLFDTRSMGEAFAYETITVSDSAVGFTAGTRQPTSALGAQAALVTVETQPIRIRMDGTDPTATVGHLLQDTDALVITGPNNVIKFRAIRDGGSDATILVTYFR